MALWSAGASSEELYFIDAHSQADDTIQLDEILVLMRQAGVKKTILSSRRQRNPFDIADFAQAHPGEIVAAVRTKGGQYARNTQKYYKVLSKQLSDRRFKAIAEVLLYHAQKNGRAEEVVVPITDQRVKAALAGAKNNRWPFVLHIEFASMSGKQRQEYINALEKLLKQNPDHPFALIHMGQLSISEVKSLIDRYPNIYFLTSHSNPIAVARSNQPWVNMFAGDTLAPEWESVIVANPQRFIFAIDNVWPEQWRNDYTEQVQLWRNALTKLPAKVANAVAHENAERLWKLR